MRGSRADEDRLQFLRGLCFLRQDALVFMRENFDEVFQVRGPTLQDAAR
jgi:hypothetical protein